MIYILLFILSFVLWTIIGMFIVAISAGIFGQKSNLGSLFGGIGTTVLTFVILRYLHQEVYPKEMLSVAKIITILIPIVLNALRALYVASEQGKTGDLTWGELPVKMKVDKYIPIGALIGVIVSLII